MAIQAHQVSLSIALGIALHHFSPFPLQKPKLEPLFSSSCMRLSRRKRTPFSSSSKLHSSVLRLLSNLWWEALKSLFFYSFLHHFHAKPLYVWFQNFVFHPLKLETSRSKLLSLDHFMEASFKVRGVFFSHFFHPLKLETSRSELLSLDHFMEASFKVRGIFFSP